MVEMELLTNVTERERLMNEERLEVLDRVKKIITLGNSDLCTVEQVANYYEVGIEAIQSLVKRNLEELKNNGMKKYSKNEILRNVLSEQNVNQLRTKAIVTLKNGEVVEINNTGLNLFSKKSILNVGMLLEESNIAKEVRTLLLDNHEQLKEVHEKLKNGEKIEIDKTNPTYYIDKETELRLQIDELDNEGLKAIRSGSINDYMLYNCKVNNIKNQIEELLKEKAVEEENKRKKLVHTSKTYTISELATELGFKSAMALNKDLNNRKIQYKVNGTWKLYSKYDGLGYTETKQTELANGKIIFNTRWSGQGRDWLVNTIFKLNKDDAK